MMRLTLMIAATALAVSACATAPSGDARSHSSELARLSAECADRGGVLEASGAVTGRPQVDQVCRVSNTGRTG